MRISSLTLAWNLAILIVPLLFFSQYYVIGLLVGMLVYITVAMNWHLLFGYAGVWSFGQLAFFAIGAYSSGILSRFLQYSPLITIPTAAILAAVVGIALGLLTLRLAGFFLAITTYGFQAILIAVILAESSITGGPLGLYSIPPLTIGSFSFSSFLTLPYYYLFYAIFALSALVHSRLLNSQIGRAFIAIRDSPQRAVSVGINPLRYRLLAFAVSCFFTGLVGAVYAHYFEFVDPTTMDFSVVVAIFLILVIGGWGTFYGPVVGGVVWTILSELLRPFGIYRFAVIGFLVVVILVVTPRGLVPAFSSMFSKTRIRASAKV